MSRKKHKNNKNIAKRIVKTIFLTVVVVLLFAVVLTGILIGIRDSYLEHNTSTQQKYCIQLSDTLYYMYNSGVSDEEAVKYIAENIEASGSSWAFFFKNDTVLFAKNMSTTDNLGELSNSGKFLSELKSQDAVITSETFQYGDNLYLVGIITDEAQFLSSGGIKIYSIYILLLFAAIALIGIGSVVALAGAWVRSDKMLADNKKTLQKRNVKFEKINNDNTANKNLSPSYAMKSSENNRYKQYKFKFYLNARHAIYIDGLLGAMHPHTWELTMNVIKKQDTFIEFNKIEQKIDEFIKQYQDKELNAVEPFDVINPTLENCCDYFKEKISDILENEGWILLMMEMSETPSRSYVISMIDENEKN